MIKFEEEFSMKSIPQPLLWKYITEPALLTEWFADKVTKTDKTYHFTWSDNTQSATQIAQRNGTYVRLHWDDSDDPKSYFEMKITHNELTRGRMLIITDFAEPDEVESSRNLWIKQVNVLKRILGC